MDLKSGYSSLVATIAAYVTAGPAAEATARNVGRRIVQFACEHTLNRYVIHGLLAGEVPDELLHEASVAVLKACEQTSLVQVSSRASRPTLPTVKLFRVTET